MKAWLLGLLASIAAVLGAIFGAQLPRRSTPSARRRDFDETRVAYEERQAEERHEARTDGVPTEAAARELIRIAREGRGKE